MVNNPLWFESGNFKNKESLALIFGFFKEKSELKNLRFQLHISKTQRTCGFHEKTHKKTADFWVVVISLFFEDGNFISLPVL